MSKKEDLKINDLPNEILEIIFNNYNLATKMKLRTVNKKFSQIIKDIVLDNVGINIDCTNEDIGENCLISDLTEEEIIYDNNGNGEKNIDGSTVMVPKFIGTTTIKNLQFMISMNKIKNCKIQFYKINYYTEESVIFLNINISLVPLLNNGEPVRKNGEIVLRESRRAKVITHTDKLNHKMIEFVEKTYPIFDSLTLELENHNMKLIEWLVCRKEKEKEIIFRYNFPETVINNFELFKGISLKITQHKKNDPNINAFISSGAVIPFDWYAEVEIPYCYAPDPDNEDNILIITPENMEIWERKRQENERIHREYKEKREAEVRALQRD